MNWDPRMSSSPIYESREAINEGLRNYMVGVYRTMGLGLAVTGLVAMFIASQPQILMAIFGTPLKWVALFAPLAIVFMFAARIHAMSFSGAQMLFWVYAGAMGVSFSSFFALYTGTSIARVFFITASLFGSMSLYGYTTRRDLTSMGSFLMMGVWGLIIASLINLFMGSAMIHWILSVLTVFIFTGLTAYDTQTLKDIYFRSVNDDADTLNKKALMGALSLYINFINIFISLMHLFGERE